ncbi:MAG TPA: hypothetical protein VJ278_06190, partial [Chthoniobacterales bacterium]|nr:hypothetical protein [Chthoniobacterales bacterium]
MGASFTGFVLRSADDFASLCSGPMSKSTTPKSHKMFLVRFGRCMRKLFVFENLDRFPRFVGRSLFVFERALQI